MESHFSICYSINKVFIQTVIIQHHPPDLNRLAVKTDINKYVMWFMVFRDAFEKSPTIIHRWNIHFIIWLCWECKRRRGDILKHTYHINHCCYLREFTIIIIFGKIKIIKCSLLLVSHFMCDFCLYLWIFFPNKIWMLKYWPIFDSC